MRPEKTILSLSVSAAMMFLASFCLLCFPWTARAESGTFPATPLPGDKMQISYSIDGGTLKNIKDSPEVISMLGNYGLSRTADLVVTGNTLSFSGTVQWDPRSVIYSGKPAEVRASVGVYIGNAKYEDRKTTFIEGPGSGSFSVSVSFPANATKFYASMNVEVEGYMGALIVRASGEQDRGEIPQMTISILGQRIDETDLTLKGKVKSDAPITGQSFVRLSPGKEEKGRIELSGDAFIADGFLIRGMTNELPKHQFKLVFETKKGNVEKLIDIPWQDCSPLCAEVFGIDGFGKDRLNKAGFATMDDVRYNTKIRKGYDKLADDFGGAVDDYNGKFPTNPARSLPVNENAMPQILSWLFTEGGMSESYSKAMTFNTLSPQELQKKLKKKEISSKQLWGTEPGLFESMSEMAKQKGKLSPKDVLMLALKHREGKLNEAMLLAHNTLRSLARGGDYMYTAVNVDQKFIADHLETIREGDNAGPWYHLFGTSYFEIETRSSFGPLRDLIWLKDLGKDTANKLMEALGLSSDGAPAVDTMSTLANMAEQIYREQLGGRIADPEKWCFNLWGARLGSMLLQKVQGPRPEIPASAPQPLPVDFPPTPKNEYDTPRIFRIALCPVNITWENGTQRMMLNQKTGNLNGDFSIRSIPLFEKDGSLGIIWQELSDQPYHLSFEAVKDGKFRFASVNSKSGNLAVYEKDVKNGETMSLQVDATSFSAPMQLADGKILNPTISKLKSGGTWPMGLTLIGIGLALAGLAGGTFWMIRKRPKRSQKSTRHVEAKKSGTPKAVKTAKKSPRLSRRRWGLWMAIASGAILMIALGFFAYRTWTKRNAATPAKTETVEPKAVTKEAPTSATGAQSSKLESKTAPEEVKTTPVDKPMAPTASQPAIARKETPVPSPAPVKSRMAAYDESLVDVKPKAIRKVNPTYPADAWGRRLEDTVVLQVLVSETGIVRSIKIVQASKYKAFNSAAETAIRQWTFSPAKKNGKPVACWLQVGIKFKL